MTNQPPGVDKTATMDAKKTEKTHVSYDESFEERFPDELGYISKSHRLVYRYCRPNQEVYHRGFYTYDEGKQTLVCKDVPEEIKKCCDEYFENFKKLNNPLYVDFKKTCEQFISNIDRLTQDQEFEQKAPQLCLNPIKYLTLFSTTGIPAIDAEHYFWAAGDNEEPVQINTDQGEYFGIVQEAVKVYVSKKSASLSYRSRLIESAKKSDFDENEKHNMFRDVFLEVIEHQLAWKLLSLKKTITTMYPEIKCTVKDYFSTISRNMEFVLARNATIATKKAYGLLSVHVDEDDVSSKVKNMCSGVSTEQALVKLHYCLSDVTLSYEEQMRKFGSNSLEIWIAYNMVQASHTYYNTLNLSVLIDQKYPDFSDLLMLDWTQFAKKYEESSLINIMSILDCYAAKIRGNSSIYKMKNPLETVTTRLPMGNGETIFNNHFEN